MKRRIRVLVFDDEKTVLSLMNTVLGRMRGYEVFMFEDPSYCSVYKEDKCICDDGMACADLIISDIKMPYVDGISFVQKQLSNGCKISPDNIMMISGYINSEVQTKTDGLGVSLLQKPFALSQLVEWLDEKEKTLDLGVELINEELLSEGASKIQ